MVTFGCVVGFLYCGYSCNLPAGTRAECVRPSDSVIHERPECVESPQVMRCKLPNLVFTGSFKYQHSMILITSIILIISIILITSTNTSIHWPQHLTD